MSDLIDRQAAIDIVEFECGEWRGLAGTIIKAIEQLPSAQPEPSQVARDIATIIENEKDMRVIERNDIVRCKDCKHWICHDRRCGYWNHGTNPTDWCCHGERKE